MFRVSTSPGWRNVTPFTLWSAVASNTSKSVISTVIAMVSIVPATTKGPGTVQVFPSEVIVPTDRSLLT